MSLKKLAVSGMVWTFAEQFGTQLISFVIGIFLARLLLPSDFGTIAMFGVMMGIASILIDGGFASSLIRTSDINEKDLSTVFWFNVIASVILYIIIYIIAPYVAAFYKLELLTTVIRAYCTILIISSFVAIQRIRFVKNLNFKQSFIIKLPSLIIGGICAIILAYKGYGVWALVYSAILQSCISTIQYWLYSNWRPKMIFDKTKFLYHFNFGYKMTLSGILEIVFVNIYTIIIGKLYSPLQLGYYNRADSLQQLPVSNISNALNKVTYPLFAKMSHDDAKLKIVYQQLLRVVIFIIAPVLIAMVVLAQPLFSFLLTDKWLPAVPYFQILAIAGILYPIHAYNLNVLQVKGRSDLFLKLEVFKKITVVAIILVSYQFGIYGLLWGQVISSVIAFFINTYYTGRFINYTGWQQALDLMPSLLLAAFCGGILFLSIYYLFVNFNNLSTLIIGASIYSILYLGGSWIFRFKEINYIKELIKK